MSLVPSLLQAIVSLDGEACVIHVGEKPYVVAPSGQVDLATRGLTFEAVNGILEQLLPLETQNALDEFGAIQYETSSKMYKVGDKLELIVPHCDPVVNEYDQMYAIRNDRVEAVWPIAARGHSQ